MFDPRQCYQMQQSLYLYLGHTEEITCLTIHPGCKMGLSGQRNGKTHDSRAHLRLWDTGNLETLCVLGLGEYEIRAEAVAFSANK